MNDANPKNHYTGIVAKWYDRLLKNEGKDIDLYLSKIQKTGSPVLELACGTGRLILPIAEAGFTINGLDLSTDMLDICEQKLKQKSLSAELINSDFALYEKPDYYQTIFISGGSFQLLTDYEQVKKTLAVIYKNLKPGGSFLFDIFNPLQDLKSNNEGVWKIGRIAESDNNEKLVVTQNISYDTDEQVLSGHYKYELYEQDLLKQTVMDDLSLRWFGRYEIQMLLENAGFTSITFDRKYVMSTHAKSLVIEAKK